MAKTIPAKITPTVLEWARKRAGYDLEAAAEKIGTDAETVAAWEAGDTRPTLRQARLLAEFYRRPLAIFYLPEPPAGFDVLNEYRRMAEREPGTETPELRLALRQAEFRREAALEILSEMGEEPRPVDREARIGEDPEKVGSRLRAWLGITTEAQVSWNDAYEAFAGWRTALEARDILVFQMTGVEMEEARGAIIPTTVLPAILLNNKDAPQGRIFTLLHEMTHLWLLRGGYQVDAADRKLPLKRQPAEAFCNAVAGAALLPAEVILPERETKDAKSADSLRPFKTLAYRYCVSPEVVARRLQTLRVISKANYAAIRGELAEAAAKKPASAAGPVPYEVRMLSQLGLRFTTMVLDAYRSSAITGSRASDYLGMKLQHLPKLEARLHRGALRRASEPALDA